MKFELSEIVYNISMIFLIIVVSFAITKFVGKYGDKFEDDK
ncbi:hypothetical protein MNB_SV-6-631 [hydrothermal vent metagenome]|uniref:Uncharacterized protein n=1 Tax=hydrothermal vent metagenome TaxID=652676 RepID=A0A1W1CCM4_9ZZZZ